MAINYQQLKDWRFKERVDHYHVRDSIIYALTLGYGDNPIDEDDLRYVYEKDTLAVPTLLAVVGAPGPWLTNPELGANWVQLLHGEHRMRFHAPVPATAKVVSRTKVTHVIDKGADKGALVVTQRQVFNADDEQLLCTIDHVSFLRADGGFGQGDEPLPDLPAAPDIPAIDTLHVSTTPQSALLYRLNGDPNPIHILPKIAKEAGFDRPILHGLCTFGIAARALIKRFCPLSPERLTEFSARFSAPFWPGETLKVKVWLNEGSDQIQFEAFSVERNKKVLSHGVASVVNKEG